MPENDLSKIKKGTKEIFECQKVVAKSHPNTKTKVKKFDQQLHIHKDSFFFSILPMEIKLWIAQPKQQNI